MTRPRIYIEPRRVVVVGNAVTVRAWIDQARASGLSLSDWIKSHLPPVQAAQPEGNA